MNKENNRGAAGLRRSAIAERIRLREEWSALKEVDNPTTSAPNALKKKPVNSRCTPHATGKKKLPAVASSNKPNLQTSDALTGVVALVDVGSEDRALPLRAVLTALGATVVREWSPLVTHLVWTDSGARSVRARARALACKLVSPLWVEACAAAARKLSERLFPAAARHSDLPSPRRLKMLLKKAERENIPLVNLLSTSKDEDDMPRLRLRVSGSDSSRDKITDTSNDTLNIETRVNTATRGGTADRFTGTTTCPATKAHPPKQPKSRRKLFTCKEINDLTSSDDDSDDGSKLHQNKLTQIEKRDLARAERMAKKLLAACNTQNTNNNVISNKEHLETQKGFKPRIVLTGMSRHERQEITKCIHKLGGVIQSDVNKRTTHVLLGACKTVRSAPCTNHSSDITGIALHCDLSKSSCWASAGAAGAAGGAGAGARTLSALRGAAGGARVLLALWAARSAAQGRWLAHHPYQVPHLRKICQKARVERAALGRLNSDYAYDVFNGMKVHVTEDAEQRDAAIQLLKLCGAVVEEGKRNLVDVVVGNNVGEVHSKWVFDSVAAARTRTTRKYINTSVNRSNDCR